MVVVFCETMDWALNGLNTGTDKMVVKAVARLSNFLDRGSGWVSVVGMRILGGFVSPDNNDPFFKAQEDRIYRMDRSSTYPIGLTVFAVVILIIVLFLIWEYK